MPAREQHREEVDDRAAADLERLRQPVDHDRGDGHHRQRNEAAAQLASNHIHCNQDRPPAPAARWEKPNIIPPPPRVIPIQPRWLSSTHAGSAGSGGRLQIWSRLPSTPSAGYLSLKSWGDNRMAQAKVGERDEALD